MIQDSILSSTITRIFTSASTNSLNFDTQSYDNLFSINFDVGGSHNYAIIYYLTINLGNSNDMNG